jgi:hypothetical protein
MTLFRRWKKRGQRLLDAVTQRDREAKIYVESIKFSGGQAISLNDSSILVIVGPNNAGKSSVLREIRDHLQDGSKFGPVLDNAEIRVRGSTGAFKKQIIESGLATSKEGVIRIGYLEYNESKVDDEIKTGFVGSKIIPFFLSYLGAEERLKIADPTRRGEYFDSAPKTPMQWLELDEGAEKRISDIFERTFDVGLALNTLAGEDLVLHIVRKEDKETASKTTREEARWFASLPKLQRQGDGMRSFTGTIMSLLVHPTSTILLDEPEAFLHPPQARRLAEIISNEVPGGCQVLVATHNDAFVRALLDASGDRVLLARIVRAGAVNRVTVLDQEQLNEMWSDPLLRTSDVLSALFHDAAILCEGDSDARFYGALMDATRGESRDADVRIFHFGGKDRIAGIARALRIVEIPVVVIVDIDVLSDGEKFLNLFEAMGGSRSDVKQDLQAIIRLVAERKGQMVGPELAVELRRVAAEVESSHEVPKQVRGKLLDLGRSSSNWQRVKHDGYRALDAQTFLRISNACKRVGVLISPEGELEGFCREISRTRKSEWLAEVMQRNLGSDPSLADARTFAEQIRDAIQTVMACTGPLKLRGPGREN